MKEISLCFPRIYPLSHSLFLSTLPPSIPMPFHLSEPNKCCLPGPYKHPHP